MQNIMHGYNDPIVSAEANTRFGDLLAGSVLSGYYFGIGTAPFRLSLLLGGDPSSVFVTWNGARVEETSDVVDAVTLLPNTTDTDRLDGVYAVYEHSFARKPVVYVVVPGDSSGMPRPAPSTTTHTLIGYVKVPKNGEMIKPGHFLPRKRGIHRLVVADEALFQGKTEFTGQTLFSSPTQFIGVVTAESITTKHLEATEQATIKKLVVDTLQVIKGNESLEQYSVYPMDVTARGLYRNVYIKRKDGTLFIHSELHDQDVDDFYHRVVLKVYDEKGTNLIRTEQYKLIYGPDGRVRDKVLL